MINLLIGKKGTGKTKRLIEHIVSAVKSSKGNVVVIANSLNLRYDIGTEARLIDVNEYGVSGTSSFNGFLSGICASNYDVTDIFVDTTLKIVGTDADINEIVKKCATLSKNSNVNITLSLSVEESVITDETKALVEII